MASAAFKYVPQIAATTFLPSILYKFLFYAPSLPPPFRRDASFGLDIETIIQGGGIWHPCL